MGELGRKKGRECESSSVLLPSYKAREVKSTTRAEKGIWRGIVVGCVECCGEEDGVIDWIVGMMNNPMIKDGIGFCAEDVFGERDIEWNLHSLNKFCAFLG